MNPELIDISGIKISLMVDEAKILSNLIAQIPTIDLPAIISTDINGLIVRFSPTPDLPWQFIFFFQNLMIMQRLHIIDNFARKNEIIK